MDPQIEKLLKDIATKMIEKQGSGWFTKLALTVIVGVLLWWLKSKLDTQGKELAAARTQIIIDRMDAERAAFLTKLQPVTEERTKLEAYAKVQLLAVEATEVAIKKQLITHEDNVAKLKAIEVPNWDVINKLAGVTP